MIRTARIEFTAWIVAVLLAAVSGPTAARPDPIFRTSLENSTCGNNVVEDVEQCDDGDAVNGDGCPTNCRLIQCGDNEIEPLNEQCDDGDNIGGDGCSADYCEVEPGFECLGEPSVCVFDGSLLPSVTSVDYPVIALGGRLVITGVKFMTAVTVSIGGSSQAFDVDSDNQITVTVNDNPPIGSQSLVVTNGNGPSSPFALTVIRLTINELDSDTAGTDVAEFVEIATGVPNVNLAGYALTFWNGTTDTSYLSLDLNASTNVSGLLLVANAAVFGTAIQLTDNTLQNGADAVGLYQRTPHVNGTAVTNANLIDALVYDTADADDAELLNTLLPAGAGRAQVDEAAGAGSETQSIQRCEPFLRNSGISYVPAAPVSPGALNNGSLPCVL